MICKICGQKGKAKNLCAKHYNRWLNTVGYKTCSQCQERPVKARNLCSRCYRQFMASNAPLCTQCGKSPTIARGLCNWCYEKMLSATNRPCKACKIRGVAKTKELCNICYQRFKYAGRLHRIKGKDGSGTVKHGYKLLTVDGKQVMEHRVIMEKHLGRKLKHKEYVHHIDGNKLNNSINNLQIVSPRTHCLIHPEIMEKLELSPFRQKKT